MWFAHVLHGVVSAQGIGTPQLPVVLSYPFLSPISKNDWPSFALKKKKKKQQTDRRVGRPIRAKEKRKARDRPVQGMILEHLGFYFNRYYSKPLSPKNFGVESEAELVELAKDCVFFNKDKAGGEGGWGGWGLRWVGVGVGVGWGVGGLGGLVGVLRGLWGQPPLKRCEEISKTLRAPTSATCCVPFQLGTAETSWFHLEGGLF